MHVLRAPVRERASSSATAPDGPPAVLLESPPSVFPVSWSWSRDAYVFNAVGLLRVANSFSWWRGERR